MPNEVFDPKKPDLKYYNDKPENHDYELREIKPRMRSVFASRRFMLIYGLFLILIVTVITTYNRAKQRDIKNVIPNRALEIDFVDIKHLNSLVTANIKIENVSYEKDFISTLIASSSLISNGKAIASSSYIYNNIDFPREQIIGVNIKFRSEDWNDADSVLIKLYLNETDNTERKIKIKKK